MPLKVYIAHPKQLLMAAIFRMFKPNFTVMKWFGLAALFGCASNVVKQGSLASGPFEIFWEVTESRSGAWFNNGGNFNAKQYTSWFSVKYKGKLVEVPAFDKYKDTPMEGTKPEKPVQHFWQALFIKDAPKPAVLVGIHSMHLLTETDGQLSIIPLHEQDGNFATYQWLDSDNGQPGPQQNVYLGDDSGSSRWLSGGRYLLVNSNVVLDVKTLETYPCALNRYEVVKQLGGYNAGQTFVAQLSPHQTQIVLVGNRDNPENRLLYQYALVAMDFKKNKAYAVPFDRTDTRFFSVWDATPAWINTYFEWTTDDAGEDRLVLRTFKQLPYWQGRWAFADDTGDTTEYKLMPVEKTMLPAFLDFIRKEVAVTSEKREETPHWGVGDSSGGTPADTLVNVELQTGEGVLVVYMNPEEQTITLHSDNKASIKKIGEHFDQAMRNGEFQAFFGRYE